MEWTPIQGNIIIPEGTKSASVYIETSDGRNSTGYIDFYVDGIKLSKEKVTAERGILPARKEVSWLNKPGVPSYPLLFDHYLIQKPAFWGVILSKDIPLY